MGLPTEFIKRMKSMLGNDAENFFKTYEYPKTTGLRVNTLKINVEAFKKLVPFHLEAIPFCDTGFYIHETDQAGKNPLHQAGLYYIQEPSAMFVAEVLNPKPGERVLDLCAAPGGKTTHIATKMNNTGLLITNDINSKRAKALSENVERLGVTNAIVTNETPERLAKRFMGYFDRILVDAPCSGEGMFRKDPEACDYWSPEHVTECTVWQKDILDSAYGMLREGGILVYSTCTFSREENEVQIGSFLEEHPDMELMPIKKTGGIADGVPAWGNILRSELENTARLWPHLLKGEGHFVAKLVKHGEGEPNSPRLAKENTSRQEMKDYKTFEEMTLSRPLSSGPMQTMGGHLYLFPEEAPELDKIKVVRPGLHLGTFKKGRFEPNHALAMALKPEDVKHSIDLSLNQQDWKKYLRGETLTTGGDYGWTLVTTHGFPLGWGKEVKGTLKNFYPKGLRIMGQSTL